ncbi:MAG: glycoside hydrolase family 97 protein [Chitinophagaceae bacterium]
MPFKQLTCIAIAIFIFSFSPAQQPIDLKKDKVRLRFELSADGRPRYSVSFNNQPVIALSELGFSLSDDTTFYRSFTLIGTGEDSVDESWSPVWGEEKSIRNNYKQQRVHLRHSGGRLLDIVFRVFSDGVGFRYEFPKQSMLRYFIIQDEYTSFNMTGDHQAFWIPGDYDSNEYSYTHSALSAVDNRPVVAAATDIAVRTVPDPTSVQTPLMMKTAGGLYLNIHEAALVNYPAMQLHVDPKTFSLTSRLVPDAVGNKAYLHAPFQTPWRTIIISDKAAGILASRMILNLNEPSKAVTTTWIRPMKFVGVWWEMQTGQSTWSYSDYADSTDASGQLIPNGKHGASTSNLKRYIDFAAKNGIGGVLAEGWNTGWEDWFGNWKENVFDFVTPYPDFNLDEVSAYAKSQGVSLIMHNETSGSAVNYDRQLDTAFRLMKNYGYPAVKTGYVGRIIPRGEHHDGQWMVNHYERVLQKGMKYQVNIDAHEPPRPTGLHRTYPNFMASEAGRGNEYHAFSNGNNPDHETILPFTRLMGGPMDYTPGIFKLKGYAAGYPERSVHSTLCKQLALYVTLYSPVQMVADLLENYEEKPDAFRFIREVPVDWDQTNIIEAEPGDYLTIARKEKAGDKWFVGAITDENERLAVIPLSFLDKDKKYRLTTYRDKPGSDYQNNSEGYIIETTWVDASSVLRIKLNRGGGAAVSLVPLEGKPEKSLKKYK